MPFQKKKGRKKGSTTTGYIKLTKEEKDAYHADAREQHRKKSKEVTNTKSDSVPESPPCSSSSSRAGRKPLHSAPMTPRTRKRRRVETQRERRKKEKISKTRSIIKFASWEQKKIRMVSDHNDDASKDENESDLDDLSDKESNLHNASEGRESDFSDVSEEERLPDLIDDSEEESDWESNLDDINTEEHNTSAMSDEEHGNGEEINHEINEEVVDSRLDESIRRQYYRHRSALQGSFTSDSVDNLKMLIYFLNTNNSTSSLQKELLKIKTSEGHLNVRQIRYRVKKLRDKLKKMKEDQLTKLLRYWVGELLDDPKIERLFSECSVLIDTEYMPRSIIVSRKAEEIARKLVTSRKNVSDNVKRTGIDYVVMVAKECSLSKDTHKDIELLAKATSCHRSFAKKVLESIDSGNEDTLYKRNLKYNAIKASHWPELISTFVLHESNSRSVPGEEQVSVRYGYRLPKYILLHSRDKIAAAFKEEHPECPFSISTIKREFPQNAVTPTTRDLERNTCPIHANARRVVKAINKALLKSKSKVRIPSSCRDLALESMCNSEDSKATLPLTWNTDCAKGTCKNCPNKLKLTLPDAVKKVNITFSQWRSEKRVYQKEVKGKVVSIEKSVFNLYPETLTTEDALIKLTEMCKPLRKHIYTSHKQWDAHEKARQNLDLNTIISIEDYQMNMEVVYAENPTSLAFSTNKMTVAMYPICIEYLAEDGTIRKGAITFISADKDHCHQQIEQFEKRMFQIVREKLKRPILKWIRYSDGCSAQFKSGYVAADLFNAPETFQINNATFNFFESHEGKSTSDSIGSIVKCAFIRGVLKYEQGILCVNDVLNVINSETKPSTKKFDFFVVEEFKRFQKRTIKSREYCKIPGIMSLHSLKLDEDKIVLNEFTCTECENSNSCEDCKKQKSFLKSNVEKPETVNYVEIEDQIDVDDDEENCKDGDDEGQTDDETDTSEDEDSEFNPGDIIWAKYGRIWYPAQIYSLADVPVHLQSQFQGQKEKVIVKWFGEDKYSSVLVNQLDVLGENLIDAARAAKSKYIMGQYNQALGQKLSYN